MKILWVSPFLLHPTEKGAQIRSLGILSKLHERHEIHVVALQLAGQDAGRSRTGEYCTCAYIVPHAPPARGSVAFLLQAFNSLFSGMPLSVSRYRVLAVRARIQKLLGDRGFDRIVCDFLHMAPNVPNLGEAVLFQHNVETVIWRRHAETAGSPLHRWYFNGQARRMEAYEGEICRAVRHVIAVSQTDAKLMRNMFGPVSVTAIPTGVNVEYYTPPQAASFRAADLVFTGSMDWLPNIDGIRYFTDEVLPIIRRRRPDCTLVIVGRNAGSDIRALADRDARIRVTGTVADVRPYLWGAAVAVVPLRIGGGTRLKIYEAMAAKTPVVSTTIGAEGLAYTSGEDIQIADTPVDFAERCVELLDDEPRRRRQAEAAWLLVNSRFSWNSVARRFEEVLLERGG